MNDTGEAQESPEARERRERQAGYDAINQVREHREAALLKPHYKGSFHWDDLNLYIICTNFGGGLPRVREVIKGAIQADREKAGTLNYTGPTTVDFAVENERILGELSKAYPELFTRVFVNKADETQVPHRVMVSQCTATAISTARVLLKLLVAKSCELCAKGVDVVINESGWFHHWTDTGDKQCQAHAQHEFLVLNDDDLLKALDEWFKQ